MDDVITGGDHGRTPRTGDPTVAVAVCGAACCAGASDEVLAALRPVVRAEPGAVLVRSGCLQPGCTRHDLGSRVRVQPWPGPGCPVHADDVRELLTDDPRSCARTVSRWLRERRCRGRRPGC